jgi:hypothetical protein
MYVFVLVEECMTSRLLSSNLRLARSRWKGEINRIEVQQLKSLTERHEFSVAEGDLIRLERGWYVTHTGLIRLANRNRCAGIHTKPVARFCDPQTHRWSFEATVYKTRNCRGFIGYGDADPSNISTIVHGAEMRVAETRAVNRALRKAYGIGICSIEEMAAMPNPTERLPPQKANGNGNGTGPKVRDRLRELIRRHQLDPILVKAYAVDVCGTKTLREATREQVENFVTQLADWAEKDRNALLCQLNSYAHPKQEVA